jgi:hypothetical protein
VLIEELLMETIGNSIICIEITGKLCPRIHSEGGEGGARGRSGGVGGGWIIKYKGGVKRGMVIIEVRPEGYTTSCAIFVSQIVFRRFPWPIF